MESTINKGMITSIRDNNPGLASKMVNSAIIDTIIELIKNTSISELKNNFIIEMTIIDNNINISTKWKKKELQG